MLGREVKALVNEFKTSGSYNIEFNSNGLSSGIYYYQIQVNNFNKTKKMILLR